MYVIGCELWFYGCERFVSTGTRAAVPRPSQLPSHSSSVHSGTHYRLCGARAASVLSSPRQKLLCEARVLNVSLPAAAGRKSARGSYQNRRSDADTGEHAADERKAADGRFADLPGRFGS